MLLKQNLSALPDEDVAALVKTYKHSEKDSVANFLHHYHMDDCVDHFHDWSCNGIQDFSLINEKDLTDIGFNSKKARTILYFMQIALNAQSEIRVRCCRA